MSLKKINMLNALMLPTRGGGGGDGTQCTLPIISANLICQLFLCLLLVKCKTLKEATGEMT